MGKVILSGVSKGMTVPVGLPQISSFAVGSVIKLAENNTLVDYIIVHQGFPSTMYDATCNGTWLLRKDTLPTNYFYWDDNKRTNYSESSANTYLNNNFLNTLNVKDKVLSIKIPYSSGAGSSYTIYSGANGCSCKVFLLGAEEVGSPYSEDQIDGVKLSYFESGTSTSANSKRASNDTYWLRTPSTSNGYIGVVYTDGTFANGGPTQWGPLLRPALILPSDTKINDDGTVKVVA